MDGDKALHCFSTLSTMYKILPHTADVRLWVTSDTWSGLFQSALSGMCCIQKKSFCEEQGNIFDRADTLDIKAPDRTLLLLDFLSEVLTMSHIYKTVYGKVQFQTLSETSLIATIFGQQTGEVDEDIKAVTYHEAEVRMNQTHEWETMVIFDI